MARVRVIAAIGSRRPAAAALVRLEARRDVELETVAGAARAAAAAWRRKPALVIFEVHGEPDARPTAGAGAFDAIQALRAEVTSRAVPVLVLVPSGREDLREQAFGAGASDVCFVAPGLPGFEEALLHLAGIPARRWLRRPAAIESRVALPDETGGTRVVDAMAMNLSGGGVQLKWSAIGERFVPEKGAVLRVEIGRPARLSVFAAVQGGTSTADGSLTRLRFLGLSEEERTRLEELVGELPGPGEAEPEATPLPVDDEAGAPELPLRSTRVRAMRFAAIVGGLLLLGACVVGIHHFSSQPVAEPHASAPR